MKETTTVRALKKLIMCEIRKYPECNGITGVAIARPANSNWDAAFVSNGLPYMCDTAWEVVHDLKQRFDLEI